MPHAAPLRPYGSDDLREARLPGRAVLRPGGLAFDRPNIVERGGLSRLEIHAGGGKLWIEADRPLAPSIEAPIAALAMHSWALGRPVRARAPVDARLAVSLDAIAAIRAQWNDWPLPAPALEAAELVEQGPPAAASAAFFTCGVDSFFTLFRRRHDVAALVHVHGYDFALDDTGGAAAMRRAIEAVAAELGLGVVAVRTNLRAHALFQALPWDLTHASALAMVAHALSPGFGRFFAASSDGPLPHGSHAALDRLWGSGLVSLETDGAPTRRVDKVATIAGWPPVHRHLQVCWEARPGNGNCGMCEKCVRTSVMFACVGALQHVRTLPQTPLEGRITALPSLQPGVLPQWRALIPAIPEPGLRSAAEDLMARSLGGRDLRSLLVAAVPPVLRRAVRRRRVQARLLRHWPTS